MIDMDAQQIPIKQVKLTVSELNDLIKKHYEKQGEKVTNIIYELVEPTEIIIDLQKE